MERADAEIRARPRAGAGRQHLHRGDERQQDREVRHENEDIQGVGAARRRTAARPGRRIRRKSLLHRNGNGSIGELDPSTGKVIDHFTPSKGGNPHTAVFDAEGNIWFTGQGGGYLGKLDRKSGR
jgi:hypothetical protein